jgi:hypothetical protein
MRSHAPLLSRRQPFAALLALTLATLAACSGDDAPAVPAAAAPVVPATVTLTGTAAVGAPLAGAHVSAQCSSGGAVPPATTDTSGRWTLTLGSAAALPCAIQVSGGSAHGVAYTQALHSYAAAAGVVNVTPLTDLSVALAALLRPEAWYAGLGTGHAPALGGTLDAARVQLLQALTAAGYVLPTATGFDPMTTVFTATGTDPYDTLLDAFAGGLAAQGTSYSTLLNDVLTRASGGLGITVPGVGISVPGGPAGGQTGPIVLVAKGGAVAADIAPLVGTYTGTLASSTATGQAPVFSSSCSIQVTTGGQFSVTVGSRTLTAPMNGDVGDLILTINTIQKAIAFDFNSTTNLTVEIVRGYVALATATDPQGAISCTLPNPHTTTAGSRSVQTVNGATAADFDVALVGTYSSGTCTVTVGSGGTLRVVTGTVDVTGTLGGDEQDVVTVFPTISAQALSTDDLGADGRTTSLSFTYTAANPSLGLGPQVAADARITNPRPIQVLANCTGLVKQ